MFKYTGQVCTSNCVFTVVHFSLFHYFLIVTPPTKPVCSHPISNMSSCCMYVLLNLVFWYIFINFVYGWVCVSNRLKVFWQVSQGVAAKSTVSSLHYQSSCSYICCISFFFSLFILFLFFLFPPKKKKNPSVNGMHCSARLNMLYLHCPLTSGQCGYTSTYHDICIVRLPKNGLHCNVCLSTVIINK